MLDGYPGSGMTDDALFLMGKSYHRLNSYRMSIRKFELLFTNYPVTEYEEESIYLQAMNYLLIGDVSTSSSLLDRLGNEYPGSEYQADALNVSADNSFVLEDWERAAADYERYLAEFSGADLKQRDYIALRYARCIWELERYEEGADYVRELLSGDISLEYSFRARLLLSRFLTRLGDYEGSAELFDLLRSEGETWGAQTEVLVSDAENLIAQGKGDDALPLLDNIPAEWQVSELKPRVNELLGQIHLRRWELDEARIAYGNSLKGEAYLEEPEIARARFTVLREYLLIEDRIGTVALVRVPALQLKQANGLLFGLDRPRLALDKYLEILANDDADSNLASRACYGAMVVYRDHVDLPDSAAIYEQRLLDDHPTSAQAYQLRAGADSDLLSFLLDRQQRDIDTRWAISAVADSGLAPPDSVALAVTITDIDLTDAIYDGDPRWQPRKTWPIRPAGRRS